MTLKRRGWFVVFFVRRCWVPFTLSHRLPTVSIVLPHVIRILKRRWRGFVSIPLTALRSPLTHCWNLYSCNHDYHYHHHRRRHHRNNKCRHRMGGMLMRPLLLPLLCDAIPLTNSIPLLRLTLSPTRLLHHHPLLPRLSLPLPFVWRHCSKVRSYWKTMGTSGRCGMERTKLGATTKKHIPSCCN